jgi:hypothetical protein
MDPIRYRPRAASRPTSFARSPGVGLPSLWERSGGAIEGPDELDYTPALDVL